MVRNGILSGVLAVVAIACASASASPAQEGALAGSWGGPHISLELTVDGGHLEYDCAHGTVDGPVVPDREGRFAAAGTHTAEHGGPVREGEEGQGRRARYRGRVSGKTLTLTVTLADSNEEIGTFTLTRDAAPRLTKCL
jgi:hypothetical protein